MTEIWTTFLFQPLLNVLIWIYNTLAGANMGWAVIILTLFLRVLLLPLSLISQRDKVRQDELEEKVKETVAKFKNDPVIQKEEYRRIIKANRISPWAKVVTLLIQFLVLVVLYRVFISGIFGEKLVKVLYPSVSFPGVINNDFYGHNVGLSHDVFWAGVVGIYIFALNLLRKLADKTWEKSEAVYLFLFPFFVFVLLWILPMAKSLFILTSMFFSDILNLGRFLLVPGKKELEKQGV